MDRGTAGPGVNQPQAVPLLGQRLVGVAEEGCLRPGLPGCQTQPQQVLLDAVAMAMGQEKADSAQLHNPGLAAVVGKITISVDRDQRQQRKFLRQRGGVGGDVAQMNHIVRLGQPHRLGHGLDPAVGIG